MTPAERGGVQAINIRVDNILRSVSGIERDLDATNANVQSINAQAGDIAAFATNPLQNPIQVVSGLTCSALGLLCSS